MATQWGVSEFCDLAVRAACPIPSSIRFRTIFVGCAYMKRNWRFLTAAPVSHFNPALVFPAFYEGEGAFSQVSPTTRVVANGVKYPNFNSEIRERAWSALPDEVRREYYIGRNCISSKAA